MMLAGLALMLLPATPLAAQDTARVNWITFHSPAMAGNLEGNAAQRGAYVVTPPGYDEHSERRYPVVYFLHGYWATPKMYEEMLDLGTAVTQAAASGNDVIVVLPDGHSRHGGGMYSSSPTTGNYEGFVAQDLVAQIDSRYRTIADPASRGLAGHSMGGYGTLRIAMKHPGIFSSIYGMSSCCLTPRVITAQEAARVDALTPAEQDALGFGEKTTLASLSVWSPDPSNPPNYWYSGLKDGVIDPLVQARMAANAPAAMLAQYVPALKSYEAIMLDIGDKDFLMQDNLTLKRELERFGVPFGWEIYEGDHGNRIAARFRSHVLPFFALHLDRRD
jgi:enterochelin esterase-like enzyme